MRDTAVHVRIGLLGPIEVLHDGRPVPLGGRKPKVVLALLAAHADRVVSADRLADAAWGEAALDRSPTTLQVYVSGLRKALGPAGRALVTVTPGYRLAADEVDLDHLSFERQVGTARAHAAAGRTEDAVRAFDAALSGWRSAAALADLDDVVELEAPRHHLDALRLAAVVERGTLLLELGRHEELVPELHGLVAEHPFREDLLSQLMLALYRSGRQAEALATFQEARRRLGDELGLEPAPAITRLERSILLHSPSIELTAAHEGPTLRWIDGDGQARRHDLVPADDPVVIGRDPASTVCVDHDPAASRQHAEIEHRDGCWWVVDDGSSTNGTFLNGSRVGRAVLASGDILRCGETAVLVQLDPKETRPRVTPGNETVAVGDAGEAGG